MPRRLCIESQILNEAGSDHGIGDTVEHRKGEEGGESEKN